MRTVGEFVKQVWQSWGHGSEAKSFKECQIKEAAFDSKNRGVQTVPIARIVGSVGRYHDFDRHFRLRQHATDDRLERLKQLMQGGVTLPPIQLYQVKDEYYVLDGNHRVAAAKALGRDQIEARILEFLPSPTTLENILYREKADFIEKTGLQNQIELTEVGQYQHLLDQIQRHQQVLQCSQADPVSFQCAATDWHTTIYQPLIALLQRSHLLETFPERTPGDLYTYISTLQWEQQQVRTYSHEIDHLLFSNMEEFRTHMARQDASNYPEMKREITVFVLMTVSAKHEARIIEKLFALNEVREVHSVHGNVDLIVKVVLSRDLLTSDAETISDFVTHSIRQLPGIVNTQTLIPGLSKVKP